eukprot:scaffold156674_cov18-Prasinocladus_malaysianus.AAC.1
MHALKPAGNRNPYLRVYISPCVGRNRVAIAEQGCCAPLHKVVCPCVVCEWRARQDGVVKASDLHRGPCTPCATRHPGLALHGCQGPGKHLVGQE